MSCSSDLVTLDGTGEIAPIVHGNCLRNCLRDVPHCTPGGTCPAT